MIKEKIEKILKEFDETIQRKWIPSQCYGHFGNYIYKDLTNSN
jgi:hypothetical protein